MSNQKSGPQPPAVSPNPLNFALAPGRRMTLQEQISNPNGSPLLWRADTEGTNWLNVDKSTGVLQSGQTDLVNVTVDASSLEVGGYEATLTFTSEGDEASASVQVLVTANVAPILAVFHSAQSLEVGLSFGTLVKNASKALPLLITNPNDREVRWMVGTGGTAWLSLNRSTGTLQPHEQQTIYVTANSAKLEAGDYAATLTLTLEGAGASSASSPITVDMHIGTIPFWDSGPHIIVRENGVQVTQLSFNTSGETTHVLQLQNQGSQNVSWTANSGGVGWLIVTPNGGSLAGGTGTTLTVIANGTAMLPATYHATLLISGSFNPNPTGSEPTVVSIAIEFVVG